MSIFTKIGAWFAKVFSEIKNDADTVAISITEAVKTFVHNPIAGTLATIADGVLGTHLPTEIVSLVNSHVNYVLAAELALKGLPDNPTEEDVLAFENSIVQAITGLSPQGKSKLYTTLAAQVYGIIETEVNKHEPITFAELVSCVEQAYQDYVADSQEDAAE